MIPDAIREDDIDALLRDFGEPVTWSHPDLTEDADLTALVDEGPTDRVPEGRGPAPLIDKIFTFRTSALPDGWKAQDARITHDGQDYRIQNHQPGGDVISFECRQL